MKNILLFMSIFIVNISTIIAQSTIDINSGNGQTVNTCNDTFVLTGNHNAGDVFTITLCDNDPDSTHVSASFSNWSFGGGDYLEVFDGSDDTYPPLGASPYDETNFQTPWAMTASPSNMTGCITFVFHSNGGGSTFEASTHCEFHCQYFNAIIDSTSEPINGGLFVDVCQGSTITFYGSGNYLYNGGLYNQSDANCTFQWDFGDGSGPVMGQNATHTFPTEGGGYQIDLLITDQYGCTNRNDVDLKVRQSMTPLWTLGTDTICPGEQVDVMGAAASPPLWDNTPTTIVAGQTYLPDGNGASYQTDLLFDVFGNQTLDSLDMLESICVNMEHSFLGDLIIQITCPDGTTVTLEEQGGGGTYLGEPVDVEDPNQPGIGWDYCWGPNPTYGEMDDEAGNYSTLPAGTYTSHDDLSGLLGCPLNGIWTITVTDNWSIDDGFIFSWGINFAPWVFPNYWGFQNIVEDYQWDGENIITYNDSIITVAPTTEGQVCYNVTITDDYGCHYDTTSCIEVLTATDPICYCETPPTTISYQNPLCFGDEVTFNYTGTADINNSTFDWNFGGGTVISGDVTGPGPIVVDYTSAGNFTVSLNVVEGICVPADSTFPVIIPEELVSTIIGTNLLCYGDTNGTINVITLGGTSPYNYTWSPNVGTTANLTGLSAGVYNVSVTYDNACINILTYEVTQPPLLQISNEESTDILCFGDGDGTITVNAFGGTPDLTFDYGNGNQINDGFFTGLSGGNYTVTITDANGCSTVSNQLTVFEPPLLEFTSHQAQNILCFGEHNGVISSTVIGGAGNYTFELGGITQNNGTFSNLGAGSYTIVVTDGNGCSITHDTIIIEPNKLVATIPEEIVICEGETAEILASVSGGTSPYYYHWSHTSSNVEVVHESPTVDTEYSVYVTDINDCISETSVCEVLVSPDVNLTASSNRDSICSGEPITITSVATDGNHNYTYYIDGNLVQSEEIIYPYQSHDYVVTVIDGCGKTATVIVPVFVYPVPPNNFYPDIMDGCQPLTVSFVETSPLDGQTFVWDFGDNSPENYGTDQNPVHIYEEPGDYDVSLTITSKDGCINTLQQNNLIHVYVNPDAKFETVPEVVSIINPTITFLNHSINADSYAWFFNDGDSSYVTNPIHSFSSNFVGDYEVVLIARTDKGCTDTVKNIVTVREEFTFYAPTAFSPDGDGINDVFYVKGSGIDLDNFKLKIYDRWGEIIFESEDIYEGWDGRAKNHKKVQNGVYKWHVIYLDGYGIEHEESGNVTIIY